MPISLRLNLRLAVAGGTMTVLALVGGVFTSGSAPEVSCDSAEVLHTAAVSAKADVLLARQAFRATNRPLPRRMAAQRREARTTTSAADRKVLRVQVRRPTVTTSGRPATCRGTTRSHVDQAARVAAWVELVAARRVLRAARQLAERDVSATPRRGGMFRPPRRTLGARTSPGRWLGPATGPARARPEPSRDLSSTRRAGRGATLRCSGR